MPRTGPASAREPTRTCAGLGEGGLNGDRPHAGPTGPNLAVNALRSNAICGMNILHRAGTGAMAGPEKPRRNWVAVLGLVARTAVRIYASLRLNTIITAVVVAYMGQGVKAMVVQQLARLVVADRMAVSWRRHRQQQLLEVRGSRPSWRALAGLSLRAALSLKCNGRRHGPCLISVRCCGAPSQGA